MAPRQDQFELPNRDLVLAKEISSRKLSYKPHIYRAVPGNTYFWAYLLTASGRLCGGSRSLAEVKQGTSGAPHYSNTIEGGETVREAIARLREVGEDPWYLYVGQDQDAYDPADSDCEFEDRNVRVYRLPK